MNLIITSGDRQDNDDNFMHIENIIQQIRSVLNTKPEIIFAYIFGSALNTETSHDVDVAVYLEDPSILREKPLYDIRLSNEIEKTIGFSVDLIIINTAPDHLIYEISKGKVIIDKDEDLRTDFITLSWKKYFDMAQKRREWFKEASKSNK